MAIELTTASPETIGEINTALRLGPSNDVQFNTVQSILRSSNVDNTLFVHPNNYALLTLVPTTPSEAAFVVRRYEEDELEQLVLNGEASLGIRGSDAYIQSGFSNAVRIEQSGGSLANLIVDGGDSTLWNSTYTTVNSFSANWGGESVDLTTVINYLSTTNVVLSSTTILDTLSTISDGNSEQWNTAYQQTSANDIVRSNPELEATPTSINTIKNIVSLSQATYDSLAIKKADTLYVIL